MKGSTFRFLVLLLLFGLVTAGCSSDDSDEGTDTTMAAGMDMGEAHTDEGTDTTMAAGMDMGEDHEGDFEFGDPMDAGMATRVIEIDAGDDFRFSPESVSVTAGETVTFRVTNSGVIPHDFLLGDAHMQEHHEEEMAEMSGDMAMHDEPNVFVLEPGETKEMTWLMKANGDLLLFGCHQSGHYAAGMKGTVTVSG